ncbi:MAG: hypothetical protein IT557_04280 [Alphaproteobacteria bacterium]|nr:hypothetical protein [Alphaproteobacteria bacterium]
MLRAFLEFCAVHGTRVLALGISGGLVVPPLATLMRPAIGTTVFGLMLLVMLRVDFTAVWAHLRRPVLVAALVAMVLVGCPLITHGAMLALGIGGDLGAGVVLMATGAAITSAPAFARLVGLDAHLALVGSVLSTLLVPFTAPPLALGLLGITLPLTLAALSARLAFVIGVPLLLALGIRRVMGPARLHLWGRAFDGGMVFLVAIYGIGVMDGVTATLLVRPWHVLGAALLAFAANGLLNLATSLICLPFGRVNGLTCGLVSSNRNMALYIAVLPADTAFDILMFFALSQLPVFLNPFLMRGFYRWLVPGGFQGGGQQEGAHGDKAPR